MPDGTGVILEDLCPGVGLPAGVADWFANVARLELGDGLDIVADALGQAVKQLGALARRHVAPAGLER